jgi:hypothetical protein
MNKYTANYPAAVALTSIVLLIGAIAWGFGMESHGSRAAARPAAPRPAPIYYCATPGDEMPPFKPCKEVQGQRDI